MAEINTTSTNSRKRVSTRIDMTPMVDLAFLLITFFMLTTTFHKSKALELVMPHSSGPEGHYPASKALTLILGEKDKIYWYAGNERPQSDPEVFTTTYAADGVRKVLLEKQLLIGKDLLVVIKPMDKSRYQNVVDILDEMSITNIKKFSIVKTTDQDIQLIRSQTL